MMKTTYQDSVRVLALLASLIFASAATVLAQDGHIQTSNLDYLTAKASGTVDVNIDEHLIQLTAKFLSSKDPDEATVKQIVNGLKGIYVKSFEFDTESQYSNADLESIRSQLRGPGWSRIVNVTSRKEGNVEVYLMTSGTRVSGLAVLAFEPKELTVVNIIGPVDLEKLTQLEGQFDIPDLEINKPKAKREE